MLGIQNSGNNPKQVYAVLQRKIMTEIELRRTLHGILSRGPLVELAMRVLSESF